MQGKVQRFFGFGKPRRQALELAPPETTISG